MLYKRNLFTLAISLAKSQGIGEAGVREIHRRYGDYLYTKGDFDGAMGQFVKTLGFLQPSYVIRKVDASRLILLIGSSWMLNGYRISQPIFKSSTLLGSQIPITRRSY